MIFTFIQMQVIIFEIYSNLLRTVWLARDSEFKFPFLRFSLLNFIRRSMERDFNFLLVESKSKEVKWQ